MKYSFVTLLYVLVAGFPGQTRAEGLYVDFSQPYCAGDFENNETEISQLATPKLGTSLGLWPTRTIPYVIDDQTTDEKQIRAIRLAAASLNQYLGLKLMECDHQFAAENDEISSFIFVTDTLGDGCSVNHVGYKKVWFQLFAPVSRAFDIKGPVINVNSPICDIDTWTSIGHEFLHALGLHHEQRHPGVETYLDIEYSNPLSDLDCIVLQYNGVIPKALLPWSSEYNPSSIMHYSFDACDSVTVTPTDKFRTRYEESALLCGYRAGVISPNACYSREQNIDGGPGPLPSDCYSIFDQERVYVLYNDIERDKFKIGDLSSTDSCIAPEDLL